jgi:hypothetical protein
MTEKEFISTVIEIIEEGILDDDCSRRKMGWNTYINLARQPGAAPSEGWHVDTGRAVWGIHEYWIEAYRHALRLKEKLDEAP